MFPEQFPLVGICVNYSKQELPLCGLEKDLESRSMSLGATLFIGSVSKILVVGFALVP